MADASVPRYEIGQVVFLKRVRMISSDKDALEREARIYEKLMRLHCQHVLQVLDFVRDRDFVAIVTEFADGATWPTTLTA